MKRRELLWLGAGSLVAPAFGAAATRKKAKPMKAPVIFLAHGAPMLLDDARWMGELSTWANAMGKPTAVLMVSAHWESRPVTLAATRTVPLVYDFYGFPERYYQTKYPAPGAPDLASRVRALLTDAKQAVADEPTRGLDHGAYVPLVAMYPKADVPVLQVSLPSLDARELFSLGQALAPLRDEGVLIVGSGFLTHNMRAFSDTTPAWASEFDSWAGDVLARRDFDALIDYRNKAPAVLTAHPRPEHFVPVLVAAGAASSGDKVTFPITGFFAGSFTKRSVQFG